MVLILSPKVEGIKLDPSSKINVIICLPSFVTTSTFTIASKNSWANAYISFFNPFSPL